MRPLTLQNLASSAYRTLGLSGSASQSAIDGAARRMRIWPDPTRIPPTPWDFPHLGPIARTRGDIEQAVTSLSQPNTRVEARLGWYRGTSPPAVGTAPSDHDAAIGGLLNAWTTDPEIDDAARWADIMRRLEALSTSPMYLDELKQEEEAGNFEKRASAAEIELAVRSLPSALAAALVPRAEAALDAGNAERCGRIVALLRGGMKSDDGAPIPEPPAVRILLDRLEDTLDGHCRELDAELRGKLLTNRSDPSPFYHDNRAATERAVAFYNQTIQPALANFMQLVGDDPNRLSRARSRCGEIVALIALGWEWSGRFVKAMQNLTIALELAEGSPAAAAIRREIDRVAPLADDERRESGSRGLLSSSAAWYSSSQATPVATTESENLQSPAFTPSRWQKKKEPKKVSKATWIFVLLFAANIIGRMISSSTPSSSRPVLETPMSIDEIRRLSQGLNEQTKDRTFAPPQQPVTRPADNNDLLFGETSREP